MELEELKAESPSKSQERTKREKTSSSLPVALPMAPPTGTSQAPTSEKRKLSLSSSVSLATNPKGTAGDPSGTPQMYVRMLLRVEPSSILLQPLSVPEHMPNKSLLINRINYSIQTVGNNREDINIEAENVASTAESQPTPANSSVAPNTQVEIIFGVLGIIQLLSGKHLIVITKREKIGSILGRDIFKIVECRIIAISVDDSYLREEEKKEERTYLALLNSFIESSNFYFSYNYDITQTLQRVSMFSEEEKLTPLWKRVDDRFFWNKYISDDLITNQLDPWILPVMDGYLCLHHVEVGRENVKYALISRRSCNRTGARYHTRGADPQGQTANFVETEQIIINQGNVSSYVETRGSIPCIWHQTSRDYKPKPTPVHSAFSKISLKNHFEEQIRLYGGVVIVNLVDQFGLEQDLGDHFETLVKLNNNPQLKYVAFDFHTKCKGNKYDQMASLLEEITPLLNQYRYYLQDAKGNTILTQDGVVRTNCVDCLDRTNVVQSYFAKYQLKTQFAHLGIATEADEAAEMFGKFYIMFQNAWADNADVMSQQYTGTGALKNDFTRTGKRSVKGIATDGLNSMKRYINKTFQHDDSRQASVDLFLGKFTVGKLDFIDEGVNIYQVYMLNEYLSMNWNNAIFNEEDGIKTQLVIDIKNGNMIEYSAETGEKTIFLLENIRHMEKSDKNDRVFNILFNSTSTRHIYMCKNAQDRKECYDSIYQQVVGTTESKVENKEEGDSVRILYASWNMRYENEAPDERILNEWIPLNEENDIITVAVQNCAYNVPEEFQSIHRGHKHVHYIVQKHVGEKYQCVMTTSSSTENKDRESQSVEENKNKMEAGLRTTSMIVLIRTDMYSKMTNIYKNKILYKEKASGNNSALWGLKNKLISNTSNNPKDSGEKSKLLGSAVHLRYMDTSLCFGNIVHSENMEEITMSMNGGYRLEDSFDYTFLTGCMKPALITEDYHQLFSTHVPSISAKKRGSGSKIVCLDDLSDKKVTFESTYWRCKSIATDCRLGHIQLGIPQINTKDAPYRPFFTQFCVDIPNKTEK